MSTATHGVVLFALLVTVIEALVIGLRRPRSTAILANLGSGACLLAALDVCLSGMWLGWVWVCLACALIAHALALRSAWEKP